MACFNSRRKLRLKFSEYLRELDISWGKYYIELNISLITLQSSRYGGWKLAQNLGMDAYYCSLYGERFRQKGFIK
jgi:hypothetical protein